MILLIIEVLLALWPDGAELVLGVLLQYTRGDQVTQEDGRILVDSSLGLGLGQLVLELVDLSDLGPDGVLLVELGLLIVLDLLLCASSLTVILHEVRADTMLDYKI